MQNKSVISFLPQYDNLRDFAFFATLFEKTYNPTMADYKSPYSITEVATLIRISALERVDLRDLITKPKDSIIQKQDIKELTYLMNFTNRAIYRISTILKTQIR